MIDIIKRIEELRLQRDWSVNYLANEAMLTQSTLSSMYKRNTPPKIEVLQNLCDAFGITLSQFFTESETNEYINNDEKELLTLYRQLPKSKQQSIITLLKK